MRHRRSYIQAIEDALACKTQAGEAALVVIARNWVREAMDPDSPNYKFALGELHAYLLGKPTESVEMRVSAPLGLQPSPESLAMLGLQSASVRRLNEYGDAEVVEVKALESARDDDGG